MFKMILAGLLAAALSGCGITVPVAVMHSSGEVMRGQATASMLMGSTFTVSDDRATCTGTFDGVTVARTVSFAAHCTDGRTGLGSALRDTPASGSGTMQMSDGTTARFVFGDGAAGF